VTRVDLYALVGALMLHAGLSWGITLMERAPPKKNRIVEFDIRKPPPPAKVEIPPAPKFEPPPEKAKPVAKAHAKTPAPTPTQTPTAEAKEPPKAPPKEIPKPVFGVSMSSTVDGDSDFAVAVGDSTVADPRTAGKKHVDAPPPAPVVAAGPPVFHSAPDKDVSAQPAVDPESCRLPYPDGEAKSNGVEGDTKLRVEIDERGKVHGVKVLMGVGYGLDEAAVKTLKTRCRFGPARDKKGQPVAFTITYTYHWVIER
jgi:TonB family protein